MDSRPSKAYIDFVNNLRDLGLSDLDLPRVALIGIANAKANILEAVLGFSVDDSRHRCTFEYRLSRGTSPWNCKISVRFVSEDNVPLQGSLTRPIADIITNKDQVPIMMKRAQIAALNPSIPMANIVSMSLDDMNNHLTTNLPPTYTRNTVCLELSDTDLIDLTFVELPDLDLDLSFEHETRKLVENMTLAQLQGNCIIVAAVPVNEDIFSRRALHLAKGVDSDGVRTIGVLTNLMEPRTPDCPHPALQLGYYYVTPRGGEAESPSSKKKATVERPIARLLVSSSSSHEQNSTESLEVTLTFMLIELIRETMPLLRVDVVHCLDQCRQEVASLPPAVAEPATYMLVILTRLSEDIHRIARGSGDLSSLLEQVHEFYTDLKLAIRKTAPNFVPLLRTTPITQDIIDYLADNEDPCEKAKPASPLVPPFCLDDMRKHISAYAIRGLSNHVPYQARKALIESFQNQWASLVSECLERVVASMVKVIIERIQVICQGHELLADHLRSLSGELIRHHLNICSEYLEAVLEIELTPYTQQHVYLNSCSESWLSKYRDIRKGRVGTKQKSNASSSASGQATSAPCSRKFEATQPAKMPNKWSWDTSPPNQTTSPAQFADNNAKDSTVWTSDTQKADRQAKPNAGSGASTTSDPKAAEAPKAPTSSATFSSAQPSEIPKAPTTSAWFGKTQPSEAAKALAGSSKFDFSKSASVHPPSATKAPSTTFEGAAVSKDPTSTQNASTSSTQSCASQNPPPLFFSFGTKKGSMPNVLPFPLQFGSSENPAKAKTDVKGPDTKMPPEETAKPNQTSTGFSTPLNIDPSKDRVPAANLKLNPLSASFPQSWLSRNSDSDYEIALAALSRLGFTGLTRSDLKKLETADEYEDEVKLMADVRGYFQIAYMRMVDYVPALIDLKFVRAVGSDILPFFVEKMGLGRPTANAICATYFAEDAEMSTRREGLTDLQMRLESAQLELFKLGL